MRTYENKGVLEGGDEGDLRYLIWRLKNPKPCTGRGLWIAEGLEDAAMLEWARSAERQESY